MAARGDTCPADLASASLRVVMVGHVDHGKSTLIGRLLHDTGSLPEGKLEAVRAMCERRGVPLQWAFVIDAFAAERDQNITIDTAQIRFASAQRPYVLIDAPGHREFIKNMVTGAAQADAAMLVIAADEGVREQSRRHGTLLSLLGIRQVQVIVNKMDLVDYRQDVFEHIVADYGAFLADLGVAPFGFIPVNARDGITVIRRDDGAGREPMAWYRGPTVIEALDAFAAPRPSADGPLRLSVQDVYRLDQRRIVAGRIESGTLRVGDRLLFSPGKRRATVATIESWPEAGLERAFAGQNVGITLHEQIFVERGLVASHLDTPPQITRSIAARVFWLGKQPLELGRRVKLKLCTTEVQAHITRIDRVLDAATLASRADAHALQRDDVAELELALAQPIALDPAEHITATGRFVLVDGYDVAGGGVVLDSMAAQLRSAAHSGERPSAEERAARNGHAAASVWLWGTGPCAQVAAWTERVLFEAGMQVTSLGGDAVGEGDVVAAAQQLVCAGLVVLVVAGDGAGAAQRGVAALADAAAALAIEVPVGIVDEALARFVEQVAAQVRAVVGARRYGG